MPDRAHGQRRSTLTTDELPSPSGLPASGIAFQSRTTQNKREIIGAESGSGSMIFLPSDSVTFRYPSGATVASSIRIRLFSPTCAVGAVYCRGDVREASRADVPDLSSTSLVEKIMINWLCILEFS